MGIRISRALITVWDKTGIVDLAKSLSAKGIEILTTGGTGRALADAGIPITPLESITGFTELIGGRVKTLHPNIFAGILARRNDPEHMKSIENAGIKSIDLVVVNLYPFAETLKKTNNRDELLEMIDIGGVALIRASAKNYPSVAIVCDPSDYQKIMYEIESTGEVSNETSKYLAGKAFTRTSNYDALIAKTLCVETFPEYYPLPLEIVQKLRYGENPHQSSALYSLSGDNVGVSRAKQHWGKELSYNNILDLDAVYSIMLEFSDENACAIVKHLSPCGIAIGKDSLEAYEGALSGDPVSAFGGIVGFTRTLDEKTANALSENFYECVLAPSYEPNALEILKKKKNIRIMELPISESIGEKYQIRGIIGGALIQSIDPPRYKPEKWEIVTKRIPTMEEQEALRFAWKAVKVVKSNAVIIAGNNIIFGIGGGLPSRLDSAKLAVKKAGERAKGAVGASDAFFPFPDAMEVLANAGVHAIVHPGGSVRDNEVIARADELGISLVLTGTRHFRH